MSVDQPRRGVLAVTWVCFVIVWTVGTVFVLALTGLACSGESGAPYIADASPAGRYCAATEVAFGSDAAVLVSLLAFAAVIALGADGVSGRRVKLLVVTAVVAIVVPVVHLTVLVALPDRCSPDNPAKPGCSHY